ncbi:hypothetical protein Dimus_033807 [Dionaea muscipula]
MAQDPIDSVDDAVGEAEQATTAEVVVNEASKVVEEEVVKSTKAADAVPKTITQPTSILDEQSEVPAPPQAMEEVVDEREANLDAEKVVDGDFEKEKEGVKEAEKVEEANREEDENVERDDEHEAEKVAEEEKVE